MPPAAPAADDAQAAARAAVARLLPPGTYRKFNPVVGSMIVVQLPGETMRCPIQRVVSPDAVVVKIDTVPMAKSHNFRFDTTVGVRRRLQDGRDVWEAQTDRDFLAEQARLVPAKKAVAPAPVVEVVKPKVKKSPKRKRVGKAKKGRAA